MTYALLTPYCACSVNMAIVFYISFEVLYSIVDGPVQTHALFSTVNVQKNIIGYVWGVYLIDWPSGFNILFFLLLHV